MLLFILEELTRSNINDTFQYISCCYLSRLPPIGMSSLNCFNTSHVVIYPSLEKKQVESEKFQYISCCYLSTLSLLEEDIE